MDDRELTYDEAEAAGFDGTGRDGDPRLPYHQSDLPAKDPDDEVLGMCDDCEKPVREGEQDDAAFEDDVLLHVACLAEARERLGDMQADFEASGGRHR